MPRSVFLGRPLPGPGEPLWLPEDRAWALALLQVEADACSSCGQPLSESTTAAAEDTYNAQLIPCHACRAIAMRLEAHAADHGDQRGLHVQLTRR